MKMKKNYNPELYWDQVAGQISRRPDANVIAGDDEPYYRHKRKLFLDWLDKVDVAGKSVLEIGSGPGGNLHYLSDKGCKEITGADISSRMIETAKKILTGKNVNLVKTDGVTLPFEDGQFDLVFTSTVLQHNTDEEKLKLLVADICRVSKGEIILFERIEKKVTGHESNLGRPVNYYVSLFSQYEFELSDTSFLKLQTSYYVCGAIRKLFNPKDRAEGEPVSKTSYLLETIFLPVTKLFDRIIPARRGLGKLHFKRNISS